MFLVISKTVTPSKNYSNNFKKEQILSYYAIQYLLFTYMICRLFEFVHIPPVAWAWADIATEAVIAAWWLLDNSTANLSLRSLICCIWLLRCASIWLICLNNTNSDENIAAHIKFHIQFYVTTLSLFELNKMDTLEKSQWKNGEFRIISCSEIFEETGLLTAISE